MTFRYTDDGRLFGLKVIWPKVRKPNYRPWAVFRKNPVTMNDNPLSHVMIQSSQQVWSPADLPNLFGFASAQLSTDRTHSAGPHRPPAKLDTDKFGNSAGDQTCWLDWITECDRGSSFIAINFCTTYWVIFESSCSWCFNWPLRYFSLIWESRTRILDVS